VEITGLQRVLSNIGMAQALSLQEIQSIFAEVGNEKGEIPSQRLVQLL